MSRSFPIERPDPRADRPRPFSVAVIAVAGVVLGVLLVRATFDEPRDTSSAAPPPPSDTPMQPEDGELAAAAPQVADAAVEAAELPADAGMQPTPRPLVARTGRGPASGRTFTLDRIAYLRCDGAENAGGPFPCPRDRALEEAALAIFEALPGCPSAPSEPGEADVRIHFERGAPPEVRLRGTASDRLDGPSVLACVSQPLSQLTTTIRAEKLIVSFRFELR